jgi:uridine kinase
MDGDRPIVVGIAGGTASGKTTLARALVAELDECLLLTHDRYYFTLPEAHQADPQKHNFDHPASLNTPRLVSDLGTLRQGRGTLVPRYDFTRHARCADDEWVDVKPYIVIEGILVFADQALRDCFDYLVYVTAPDDLRLSRRIRRDMAERGRSVDEVLQRWECTVRPMHHQFIEPSRRHAGLVVEGTVDLRVLLDDVLAFLSVIPRSKAP